MQSGQADRQRYFGNARAGSRANGLLSLFSRLSAANGSIAPYYFHRHSSRNRNEGFIEDSLARLQSFMMRRSSSSAPTRMSGSHSSDHPTRPGLRERVGVDRPAGNGFRSVLRHDRAKQAWLPIAHAAQIRNAVQYPIFRPLDFLHVVQQPPADPRLRPTTSLVPMLRILAPDVVAMGWNGSLLRSIANMEPMRRNGRRR